MTLEPEHVRDFRDWFLDNGGYLHPSVEFCAEYNGMSVKAKEPLPADTTIAACPFSLAVTADLTRKCLRSLFPNLDVLDSWSERQLFCTYISMHFIKSLQSTPVDCLLHHPYVKVLPKREQLVAPLHFTDAELALFEGTNLYGATLDRRKERYEEWGACRDAVASVNAEVGREFTWDLFKDASTYLSSRGFPSTLLSDNPSLIMTESTYPVLLPGVDSLNHARGQAVTWNVATPPPTSSQPEDSKRHYPAVSLILHNPVPNPGSELYNNYGPKPNSEFILGYGFSLPENPDDTIVLKISAINGKWEIGRGARGVERMFNDMKTLTSPAQNQNPAGQSEEEDLEDSLGTLGALIGMSEELLLRLRKADKARELRGGVDCRSEVLIMHQHYVSGQIDIVTSILSYAETKEQELMRRAEELGIQYEEEEEISDDVEE